MLLGIEIGGTKLQLAVGEGDGTRPIAHERFEIDRAQGAAGILDLLRPAASMLASRHDVRAVGIGFGGPVDGRLGRAIKSHQVTGWDDFPLVEWVRGKLGVPAVLENDCDAAALAEARYGAGKGHAVVLYVTVGTGIGGGLVLNGEIFRGSGRGAAEIGHLRPGLNADRPELTVESLASGLGIAAAAQAHLSEPVAHPFESIARGLAGARAERLRQRMEQVEQTTEEFTADLLARAGGASELLSAKIVAQAAADGNELAREVMLHAAQALGWGIAQTITLVSPSMVVLGGGVSLAEPSLLLEPVRRAVDLYVFPPLAGTFQIAPAAFGELVVVQGALTAARMASGTSS